jgi:hypothetical protein
VGRDAQGGDQLAELELSELEADGARAASWQIKTTKLRRCEQQPPMEFICLEDTDGIHLLGGPCGKARAGLFFPCWYVMIVRS